MPTDILPHFIQLGCSSIRIPITQGGHHVCIHYILPSGQSGVYLVGLTPGGMLYQRWRYDITKYLASHGSALDCLTFKLVQLLLTTGDGSTRVLKHPRPIDE